MLQPNFKGGLIPVATQDYQTGEVLMIAFMNEAAFKATLETGCVHYWSRTKKSVWKKGEISGHFQWVKETLIDCDEDALVIKVEQVEAACHTGFRSCFFRRLSGDIIGHKVFDPVQVYK